MIKNLLHNLRHYFIFKFLSNIKLQKEVEKVLEHTAAQSIFIDLQKQLTRTINERILVKYKKQ